MTDKEKQEIIELVHKTLRGFFEPFPEGELGCRPFTQTEKVLLEVNKAICEKIKEIPTVDRPHGTCKTCKHYNPYREQFSYRNRGDGYCKSTITNAEGKAYINCHDEWYCANYDKVGDRE